MEGVRMGDGKLESSDYYITDQPSNEPMGEQSTHNTHVYSTEEDSSGCCDTDEHNGNENREDKDHDENFLK